MRREVSIVRCTLCYAVNADAREIQEEEKVERHHLCLKAFSMQVIQVVVQAHEDASQVAVLGSGFLEVSTGIIISRASLKCCRARQDIRNEIISILGLL